MYLNYYNFKILISFLKIKITKKLKENNRSVKLIQQIDKTNTVMRIVFIIHVVHTSDRE